MRKLEAHRFRLQTFESLLSPGLKSLALQVRIRRHHGPALVLTLGEVVGHLDGRRLEGDGAEAALVERLAKARVGRRREGPDGRVGISK